jgi:hypothetical protein
VKRKCLILGFCLTIGFGLPVHADAQFVIAEIVKLVIKKVINAIDLAVQQLQNKTIVLQNAQKELENAMSKLKLDEISDWVEKQRKLYEDYYNELWQVKQVIADYDKVKTIIQLQSRIVSDYTRAYSLFKQDKHFTPKELDHMFKVYTGILNESLKNIDQVLLVVNSLVTQMQDADRMEIIDQAAKQVQKNYDDLWRFNQQNVRLSLDRGAQANDIESVKKLYGIP